jgi:hypothetical protein
MQRTLKTGLWCRENEWRKDLLYILLGLQTAVSEETGVSPAELTYRQCVQLPGEFCTPGTPMKNESAYEYAFSRRG